MSSKKSMRPRRVPVPRSHHARSVSATLPQFRIGHGVDIHRFATGRRFVLGGICIPHERGLLGHSDADALIPDDFPEGSREQWLSSRNADRRFRELQKGLLLFKTFLEL